MASDNKGSHSKGPSSNKPAQRSSKKPRKPVTIDLESTKVASNPTKKPATGSPQKATTNPTPTQNVKPSAVSAVPSVKSSAVKPKPAPATASEKKPAVSNPAEKNSSSQINKAPPAPVKKPDSKPAPRPDQNSKVSASSTTGNNSGGGSGMGNIFSGLLGGIIALAGAFFLQQSGIISTDSTNNSELSAKVDQLGNDLKGFSKKLDGSAQPDVNTLISRIAELEAQQKAAATELANQNKAVEASSAKFAGAIEAAVVKTESLQQSISSGAAGENAALSTLDERLKAVEAVAANMADSTSGAFESQLEAVKKQLAEITDKVASISATDSSQTTEALEETTTRLAELSAKIAEISKSTNDDQAGIAGQISSVESSLSNLQDSLTGLVSRLDEVETIASTPRKDEQRVARALAVAGLKSAIDGGGNFENALVLVESLGKDTQATDPLKPFAATGVPTISALESTFSNLSNKIVQAATPADNSGTMDKLFSNIRSLVTIKSTGVIEGDDPQAIVSRIKHGLKNSDLEAVIKEWDLLPDAAKVVSDGWGEKVKARHSANYLVKNLLKQFMTGASGAGN